MCFRTKVDMNGSHFMVASSGPCSYLLAHRQSDVVDNLRHDLATGRRMVVHIQIGHRLRVIHVRWDLGVTDGNKCLAKVAARGILHR